MTVTMWKPLVTEDTKAVAEAAALYTGHTRAFVVYETGTIVFSDTDGARPDGDYEATLLAVVRETPNFTVQTMQQGNFLVRFKGPVTGLVLGDFFRRHGDAIRDDVDRGALFPGEEVRGGTDQVSQEHYYVGLYARAKLYADASRPVIRERFVPPADH